MNEGAPLILTARMDTESQQFFEGLRQAHFPPERNYLKAHVTLFHALPGEKSDQIQEALNTLARNEDVLRGGVVGLRFLGFGVAFVLQSERLNELRARLAARWKNWLGAQDRQSWRPHITVQNKVKKETASELLKQLEAGFEPRPIAFLGIDLWRYEGGPWSLAASFAFEGSSEPSPVRLGPLRN